MRAYILVTTKGPKVSDVQAYLWDKRVAIEGLEIVHVDGVAGPYDLVVVADTDDPQLVGQLVVDTIRRHEDVTGTVTMVQLF